MNKRYDEVMEHIENLGEFYENPYGTGSHCNLETDTARANERESN